MGNPINHSTHVGFSFPPLPAVIALRSLSVISPSASNLFNFSRAPVHPQLVACGVGYILATVARPLPDFFPLPFLLLFPVTVGVGNRAMYLCRLN